VLPFVFGVCPEKSTLAERDLLDVEFAREDEDLDRQATIGLCESIGDDQSCEFVHEPYLRALFILFHVSTFPNRQDNPILYIG
jgi:hypothetical protein